MNASLHMGADDPEDPYPAGQNVTAPSPELAVDDVAGELAVAVYRRSHDSVVKITVGGTVDRHTCHQLWTTLDQVFRGPACRVVVDASTVTSLDRAGIDVLQNVAERAAEWDLPFAVCGLRRQFSTLIRRSGVDVLAYDDVALADQAVRERFLPGEPTRLDLLREIAELRAAAPEHGLI